MDGLGSIHAYNLRSLRLPSADGSVNCALIEEGMSQLFKSKAYSRLLTDIKDRIRSARLKASLAVNRELVLLYWEIGSQILVRQKNEGWGSKVIDNLARDLAVSFPGMKGFSPRNIKYMRAFAEAYPERSFVQQAVAQIPWGHNVRILDYVKVT